MLARAMEPMTAKPPKNLAQDEQSRNAELRFLGLPESASPEEISAAVERLDDNRREEFYDRFVEPFEPPWREVIYFVEDDTAWDQIKAFQACDPSVDDPADAIVLEREGHHDPDFDGPLIVELRREPNRIHPHKTIRVERPVKQDSAYRRHVRRLNAATYQDVLEELKLVASPRRRHGPPSPLKFYKYDWLMMVPYAREFIRKTRRILSHPPAKRRRAQLEELDGAPGTFYYWAKLANEAAPVIDKMLVRGADARRGRPPAQRSDAPQVIAAL